MPDRPGVACANPRADRRRQHRSDVIVQNVGHDGIALVIEEKYTELALRVLRKAFELDQV